jgi:hypothetical protein
LWAYIENSFIIHVLLLVLVLLTFYYFSVIATLIAFISVYAQFPKNVALAKLTLI